MTSIGDKRWKNGPRTLLICPETNVNVECIHLETLRCSHNHIAAANPLDVILVMVGTFQNFLPRTNTCSHFFGQNTFYLSMI